MIRLLLLVLMGCVFAWADDVAFGVGTNVPPPSKVYIIGNGSPEFLGFTNVYLTRRAQKITELEFHLGSDHDSEGELLYFYWYEGDTVVSNFPRFTNDYPHGLHTLHVAVTDNRDLNDLRVPLEVISPLDAMRRLRADLELAGVRENIARLRPLLRLAEKAIHRRAWNVAQRRLERFNQRLYVYIDGENESGEALLDRWEIPTRRIIQSIQPVRRGPINPPGVFPGP